VIDQDVAMVSTYAPSRCGIARFTASLQAGLHTWGRSTDVYRLVQNGDVPSREPSVQMEFDPSSAASVGRARYALSRYPAVIVQHEFGIFGPDDGRAIEGLLTGLEVPVMAVLHTIPLRPNRSQREIMEFLAAATSLLVVPSHAARVALEDVFGVIAEQVSVFPHGSNWEPAEIGGGDRRQVLTWGLLGPGKGIERAIEAMALLGDLDLTYRVVGQTHPTVLRHQGYGYRKALERLIADRGLENRVFLDEGYKSESDLYQLVTDADVVVIPYDNNEQACSGVLTDAVRAGRPVVATNFPHARELLSTGAGIVVGHEDPAEMSDAIRALLTDDISYRRAVAQARYQGRRLSWADVAQRYEEALARLTTSLAVG